ncbi:MAG: hypothetical protein ACD_30C00037G0004 [uncultured bacterium]|nr:MAG: hypothetical protein ACD_30C00037G0004 [uncultured bacterium]
MFQNYHDRIKSETKKNELKDKESYFGAGVIHALTI